MSPLPKRPVDTFAPPFVVGALAVAVFVAWAAKDAGYAPTTWYPGALFALGLAVVTAVAYGRLTPSRPALVAIGFLAAFAVWSGLSITWSSDRGIAWDGANRTFLYLVVYALFVSVPWRRQSIPVLLCGFSLAVLAIGLIDLSRAMGGDTARYFMHGRFSAPAGYPNAACALFMLAFWPLAYVAARREPAILVRGALLAAAAALLELALLAQSRGSLFAVPVAVIAYLVLVPGRLRAAVALIVVAVAVFAARSPLLDLFDSIREGRDPRGHIQDALAAIGITAAAVLVLWALVAFLDKRINLAPRAVRVLNVTAIATGAGALVACALAVGLANPGPGERLGNAWRHFKAGYPADTGGSHFSLGVGSNRYDFWRVALDEFRDHPIRGVGVDNFATDYIRERRSNEEPLYPHSLELRVLAQTGIVGSALFVGFLVAAGIAVARGVGAGKDLAGGAARAGVAAALYIAIHGSADWFWEFPALTAPALAWLGLAASRPRRASAARAWHPAIPIALCVAAIAAAPTLVFPWLAEVDARRAVRTWTREPAQAFSDLDRSRRLNPLSSRADILSGVIAGRLHQVPRMRLDFRRALQRDPRLWYAHFELGLAEVALGHRGAALRELRRAAELNPGEPIVATVRRRISLGQTVDRGRIDRLFAARVRTRVGP